MKLTRLENSDMIKSMIHGKPSLRPQSAQFMYEVFTWGEPQQRKEIKNEEAEQEYFEYDNATKEVMENEKNKQNSHPLAEHICTEQPIGEPLVRNNALIKKQLKPKQIKKELYMEEKADLRRSHSVEALNLSQPNYETKKIRQTRVEERKLDETNENDKKIIESRKNKIKEFKQFTRELPNSAFTSYYGRPAFEAYGRCNTGQELKTHNVNPHRGENKPETKQTYEGAIEHGKKIQVSDRLPRKPIERSNFTNSNNKTRADKIPNLPLEKPDLVNHVRFSEPRQQSSRKDPVPSHKDINQTTRRTNQQSKTTQKKKRNNKTKTAFEFNDGLKYLNIRDNLITLMEEKKTRDSRLAYKVTECYPQNPQLNYTEPKKVLFDCPAGLEIEKGDTADDVIYSRF